MQAGLLIRIRNTAARRGATAGRMPTCHSLAPLADIPDREGCDGGDRGKSSGGPHSPPCPCRHRRRLGTTNGLERLDKEIKPRTRVAPIFPNEASLLRLASAVLSEINDD